MSRYVLPAVVGCCLLAAVVGATVLIYQRISPSSDEKLSTTALPATPLAPGDATPVRLSPQARENLGLISKPLKLTNYWRTLEVPGVIVDRPGVSDRGVIAPVTGVVTDIAAFPGDSVAPDAPLFTIRLVSESLHASQMELFKATQDIEIANSQLKRLSEAAESGAVPKSRIIEIENEIKRLNVAVEAYGQDLQSRGLSANSIGSAAAGKFVAEIVVRVPAKPSAEAAAAGGAEDAVAEQGPPMFEVQSLTVELGQQVEAGEVLAQLADHRALFIEGQGFRDDMPLIQRAAQEGWKAEIDLGDAPIADWPPVPGLPIHHIANSVNPETRTFAFFLSLENQSRTYVTAEGASRRLWRFRPGTQLRIRVPVEEFKNVFVAPQAAIVREGPEAYIFRQNGEFFDRRPVQILYEDRLNAVIAADGGLRAGFYVAHNSAAALNRIMKSQATSGAPAGVHVHPDGTVHAAH
jgi:membrane fusion protein, heavy metal efflux system